MIIYLLLIVSCMTRYLCRFAFIIYLVNLRRGLSTLGKLKRWCCRYAVDCTTNIRCANVASVLYYHVLFV